MKLALKIAAAVTIVIALVFGVDGVFRVQRQLRAFEADTRRDHLSMGRATAAAITESYLSYGESVAMDIIARIGRKTQKVHVGWVSHDTLGGADINAQLGPVPQAKLLTGSPVSKLRENKDGHREMITFVPVLPRGNVVGAVKISESLVRQSQYVRNTVIRTAATTIMAILICAGATLLLGFYLIGRPIRRLAQQAGSIGKGDFGKQLTFSQRDEIADLSNEMNTMAEKLVEAIQKIEFETKAHLETLDQLRHADRLKTVGQLTSGVVHEIGTPLTVIGGRAKMIETGEAEGGEARDCARIIVQQAEKVTGVVRQILNFARKDQDELGIQDIVPVVNDMVVLLKPVAVKSGVFLEFEPVSEGAFAKVDASQIQQVLANLIINAIQASPSGGRVTVSILEKTAAPPDGPNAGVPGSYWVIRVSDKGCGIPQADISRIFESFYTTKASGSGTGLGLAISKEIIRDHGGWMRVDSAESKGSTFEVYLTRKKRNS